MTGIRVLLVDDHQLVRAGYALIIEGRDDLEVVGEAADGGEAAELAAAVEPDIVLMDIRMPRIDGIEGVAGVLDARPAARVIMLTTFDDDTLVYRALRAGASGFLLKDIRPPDLVDAIRVVHSGDALLAPSVTRRLIDRVATGVPVPTATTPRIERLTEREGEVLAIMARGASNAEIAAGLTISETTVKTHVAAVLRKLEVRDRVQAVIAAFDAGLVRPGSF